MSEFTEKHLIKTAERLGVASEKMPRHVAIIMDGNGRWAQRQGLPRVEGHKQGGKVVEKIALASVDLGFEALTIYSFSTENWKRPKEEIGALMELYRHYLIGIRPMLEKNHVKLIHIGRREGLPGFVLDSLDETMEITKDNDGMVLSLALNYSGRAEMEDAVREIGKKCKSGEIDPVKIDENTINEHLYTSQLSDPDLLIRTANELRISNFLLWQIAYSEFYVTDICWPDFNKEQLEKAVLAYATRNRQFGAIDTK